MDIIIEAVATTAFIIGFYFGPAIVLEMVQRYRDSV